MNLFLQRDPSKQVYTLGELYWDTGEFEAFTLEDVCREQFDVVTGRWVWKSEFKVPRQTAIPSGRYRLVIDFSQRYQRLMPHILDVPDFTGIRIHSGNTEVDTSGCVLVARVRTEDKVLESKLAFASFFPRLQEQCTKDDVVIEIINSVADTPKISTRYSTP
jgi:hypothetical protein